MAQPNILYHEARYDPMKDSSSIVALLRELVEIMTGLTIVSAQIHLEGRKADFWSMIPIQLANDTAKISL